MKRYALAAALSLGGCSSESIDSHSWSCPSLVEPIIEMSKEKSPQILELSGVHEVGNLPGYKIECWAYGEWSDGGAIANFGAHVTDGGSVILEYSRRN